MQADPRGGPPSSRLLVKCIDRLQLLTVVYRVLSFTSKLATLSNKALNVVCRALFTQFENWPTCILGYVSTIPDSFP